MVIFFFTSVNVEQRTEKKMHTKKTIGQKSALLLYDLVAEIPYRRRPVKTRKYILVL